MKITPAIFEFTFDADYHQVKNGQCMQEHVFQFGN